MSSTSNSNLQTVVLGANYGCLNMGFMKWGHQEQWFWRRSVEKPEISNGELEERGEGSTFVCENHFRNRYWSSWWIIKCGVKAFHKAFLKRIRRREPNQSNKKEMKKNSPLKKHPHHISLFVNFLMLLRKWKIQPFNVRKCSIFNLWENLRWWFCEEYAIGP